MDEVSCSTTMREFQIARSWIDSFANSMNWWAGKARSADRSQGYELTAVDGQPVNQSIPSSLDRSAWDQLDER